MLIFSTWRTAQRAKFVNALELADDDSKICIRSLINLADRFQRANEAAPDKEESEAKPVSFVVPADGKRVQATVEIYERRKAGKTLANLGINILDSVSRFDSKRLLFFITLQGYKKFSEKKL